MKILRRSYVVGHILATLRMSRLLSPKGERRSLPTDRRSFAIEPSVLNRRAEKKPSLGGENSLEPFVLARWSEMKIERVSRKIDSYAVVCRHIHRRKPRSVNPLHGHLIARKSNLMVPGLAENHGSYVFVALIRTGATRHRNLPQIILKGVVRQLRRNDLITRVDQPDDCQTADDRPTALRLHARDSA